MKIVIKLGTNLLTKSGGDLDKDNMFRIVREIGALLDDGIEVIIVSSGAIGAGCGNLKCDLKSLSLREKQAVASVGQTDLMNAYREAFSKQNRTVGQMLITAQDMADRRSYLNIRNTLFTLLKMKIIPIINENDTVAVEEINFGDNDQISAIITSKVDADKLVILTDVEGLMSDDGKLIKEIKTIDDEIEKYAGPKGSLYSVGGMLTKVKASRIVSKLCGVNTYLANGRREGVLNEIVNGENPGTVFLGEECGVSHKKRWIAYGLSPTGRIILDAGAVSAIKEKKSSLLSVGIIEIEGDFEEGDSVNCADANKNDMARGLINYSSHDLRKIIGKKSSEIIEILGYKDYDEVIHRDNLVLI